MMKTLLRRLAALKEEACPCEAGDTAVVQFADAATAMLADLQNEQRNLAFQVEQITRRLNREAQAEE